MTFVLTDSQGRTQNINAVDIFSAAESIAQMRECKTARAMIDDRKESAIVILKSGECFRIERAISPD